MGDCILSSVLVLDGKDHEGKYVSELGFRCWSFVHNLDDELLEPWCCMSSLMFGLESLGLHVDLKHDFECFGSGLIVEFSCLPWP